MSIRSIYPKDKRIQLDMLHCRCDQRAIHTEAKILQRIVNRFRGQIGAVLLAVDLGSYTGPRLS